jgi:hypothetical protein
MPATARHYRDIAASCRRIFQPTFSFFASGAPAVPGSLVLLLAAGVVPLAGVARRPFAR